MHILLTVIAGLSALLCTALAFRTWTIVDGVDELLRAHERGVGKLNAMTGRVVALEGALEQLRLQHQKLAGKFHASQRERDSETPPATAADVGPAPAGLRSPALDYCDNWALALANGPNSEAARCDCAYCNWRRAERNRVKADLLPAARAATLGASRARE